MKNASYKNVRLTEKGEIKFKLLSPDSTITIINWNDSDWEWKWTHKMPVMDYSLHCEVYEIVKRVRRKVIKDNNKYDMTVTFHI